MPLSYVTSRRRAEAPISKTSTFLFTISDSSTTVRSLCPSSLFLDVISGRQASLFWPWERRREGQGAECGPCWWMTTRKTWRRTSSWRRLWDNKQWRWWQGQQRGVIKTLSRIKLAWLWVLCYGMYCSSPPLGWEKRDDAVGFRRDHDPAWKGGSCLGKMQLQFSHSSSPSLFLLGREHFFVDSLYHIRSSTHTDTRLHGCCLLYSFFFFPWIFK